ncbi:hypothetical protein MMC09_003048 [Bachmanniomyces sp. S44760]|nr:hypothetical protein [Bachmanniomyces sp. S44760]
MSIPPNFSAHHLFDTPSSPLSESRFSDSGTPLLARPNEDDLNECWIEPACQQVEYSYPPAPPSTPKLSRDYSSNEQEDMNQPAFNNDPLAATNVSPPHSRTTNSPPHSNILPPSYLRHEDDNTTMREEISPVDSIFSKTTTLPGDHMVYSETSMSAVEDRVRQYATTRAWCPPRLDADSKPPTSNHSRHTIPRKPVRRLSSLRSSQVTKYDAFARNGSVSLTITGQEQQIPPQSHEEDINSPYCWADVDASLPSYTRFNPPVSRQSSITSYFDDSDDDIDSNIQIRGIGFGRRSQRPTSASRRKRQGRRSLSDVFKSARQSLTSRVDSISCGK